MWNCYQRSILLLSRFLFTYSGPGVNELSLLKTWLFLRLLDRCHRPNPLRLYMFLYQYRVDEARHTEKTLVPMKDEHISCEKHNLPFFYLSKCLSSWKNLMHTFRSIPCWRTVSALNNASLPRSEDGQRFALHTVSWVIGITFEVNRNLLLYINLLYTNTYNIVWYRISGCANRFNSGILMLYITTVKPVIKIACE